MKDKPFLDTNIIIYLLSADDYKADLSEQIVTRGGTVSVQVLNEFLSVATRKLGLTQQESADVLNAVRRSCNVIPLTLETHDLGVDLIDRYGFSIYDAMIVAAALTSGAKTLYSEDMQNGLLVDNCLRIVNPYATR
ncbi:PIN domain-containing protein [Spongiibacter sp. KMU-158]|uniref:PIN domain-containing protein n=1 Tax=Spongiibacter pelagi TaxID=2760804 RepID=A0A927GX40_9GAMM|nr:PIN domain-containing protein [Spongiibacter pelagi]MBD2860120.1 PIN domain-containing protein [Spongiibacter pelagi]